MFCKPQVHSFDFASGEWKLRTVTDRIDSIYEGAVVTIEAGVSKIEATIHHPFWVFAGHDLSARSTPRDFGDDEDQAQSLPGRWVNSHELLAGDTIIGKNGEHLTIERISQRAEASFPVSNLTIGDYHNFAVGANSILVHNESICKDGELWLRELLESHQTSLEELEQFVKGFDNADDVMKRLSRKTEIGSTRHIPLDHADNGAYKISFESGNGYAGKGGTARARQSARRHSRIHNDRIKNIDHFTASKNGFFVEFSG